jgi:hypothetical protein
MRSADIAGMRVKRTPSGPPGALAETTSPEAVMTSLEPGNWNCSPTKRVAEPAPLMGYRRIPVRLMSEALER